MAGKQNFHKEKIQIAYEVKKFDFKQDKSIKIFGRNADAAISKIEKDSEWSFDFALKSKKQEVDRVKEIVYPRVNNGHIGEDGHDWQWQIDAGEKGSGSTDRLYLDGVKPKISKQKVLDKPVKVGRDEYTVIEVEIELSGTFSADKKH